jgi:hypothetical protein
MYFMTKSDELMCEVCEAVRERLADRVQRIWGVTRIVPGGPACLLALRDQDYRAGGLVAAVVVEADRFVVGLARLNHPYTTRCRCATFKPPRKCAGPSDHLVRGLGLATEFGVETILIAGKIDKEVKEAVLSALTTLLDAV